MIDIQNHKRIKRLELANGVLVEVSVDPESQIELSIVRGAGTKRNVRTVTEVLTRSDALDLIEGLVQSIIEQEEREGSDV